MREWKSVVVGGTTWKRTRVAKASEQTAAAAAATAKETIIRPSNFIEEEFRVKLLVVVWAWLVL